MEDKELDNLGLPAGSFVSKATPLMEEPLMLRPVG